MCRTIGAMWLWVTGNLEIGPHAFFTALRRALHTDIHSNMHTYSISLVIRLLSYRFKMSWARIEMVEPLSVLCESDIESSVTIRRYGNQSVSSFVGIKINPLTATLERDFSPSTARQVQIDPGLKNLYIRLQVLLFRYVNPSYLLRCTTCRPLIYGLVNWFKSERLYIVWQQLVVMISKQTFYINSGVSTQKWSFTIHNDFLEERKENFQVILVSPVNAVLSPKRKLTKIVIKDSGSRGCAPSVPDKGLTKLGMWLVLYSKVPYQNF